MQFILTSKMKVMYHNQNLFIRKNNLPKLYIHMQVSPRKSSDLAEKGEFV